MRLYIGWRKGCHDIAAKGGITNSCDATLVCHVCAITNVAMTFDQARCNANTTIETANTTIETATPGAPSRRWRGR